MQRIAQEKLARNASRNKKALNLTASVTGFCFHRTGIRDEAMLLMRTELIGY
jgi:hypothetical protein